MRQETLNGARIPYDAPIDELEKIMASKVMQDFSLACEALSYKHGPKAYEIMRSYINDKDKYRRLYIMKTIFRHPQALELTDFLKSAITSDDYLFVEHGLFVIADYGIKVPDDLLFSVIYKNLDRLSRELCALKELDISEENYIKLTELLKKARACGRKRTIAEVLSEKYLPSKAKELFELLSKDELPSIRILGVKIGREYGYDLKAFFSDMDGHIRKQAAKSLGKLEFLLKYMKKYHVDVSDDLSSAMIYNPVSDDHISVFYEKYDSFTPYEISFAFQHIHATDEKNATEWIDGIINENRYSIEFFLGEQRCFGGEITSEELSKLSYEFLEKEFAGGMSGLLSAMDNFKIRGWSGKKDVNGRLVRKDGKNDIELTLLNLNA